MDNIKINFCTNQFKNTDYQVNNYLRQHLKQNILLLVSTGSSLSLLPLIDTQLFGNNFTIGVLDERYDESEEINNFLQIKKTKFYKDALQHNCTFIDTSIRSDDTLDKKSKEFEMHLRDWRNKNPNGEIIITQGIGKDGHTAGIFPFDESDKEQIELLTNGKHWVIGYDVKDKNPFPLRITPTYYFLKNIVNKSFIFITGEDKKEIFHKVMHSKNNMSEVPARIIHKMKNVEIYTNISI